MSRKLMIVVAISMMISCGNVGGDLEGDKDRIVAVEARINNEAYTRTSHCWSDSGLATLWSEEDKISIFESDVNGSGFLSDFSLISDAGSSSGAFSGFLPAGARDYYAVYPTVKATGYDSVSFDMTADQIHSGALDDMTHLSGHGIMYGSFSEDGNGRIVKPLSFRHLTSAFKFNVMLPEAGIVSLVQFRVKDGGKSPFILKGTFDASSGVVAATLRSNSIWVYGDSVDAVTTTSAIMMFIPTDIAGMVMEVVVTVDEKAYVKEITIPADRILNSGVCYNVKVDCVDVVPTDAVTITSAGTLSAKLSSLKEVAKLKINTIPGVELAVDDFKAIYNTSSLKVLDISGISNTTLSGTSSYSYLKNITSVVLPANLRIIDSYAFFTSALEGDVLIPSSVVAVGDFAFQKCASLASLTIPANVTTIGRNSFNGCPLLTSLTIESGAGELIIGQGAMMNNGALTGQLVMPTSLVAVGNYAFSGCGYNSDTDATSGIYFVSSTPPELIGVNAFYGQRVFVESQELKEIYEASTSWVTAIPKFKGGRIEIGQAALQ